MMINKREEKTIFIIFQWIHSVFEFPFFSPYSPRSTLLITCQKLSFIWSKNRMRINQKRKNRNNNYKEQQKMKTQWTLFRIIKVTKAKYTKNSLQFGPSFFFVPFCSTMNRFSLFDFELAIFLLQGSKKKWEGKSTTKSRCYLLLILN